MFTTYNGGIIDDCIVTRTGENNFYVVSNAGRADVDLHHMKVLLHALCMYCIVFDVLIDSIE